MKTTKLPLLIFSGAALFLILSIPVSAQHVFRYRSGMKSPDQKTFSHSLPASAGIMESYDLSGHRQADRHSQDRPHVRPDSMISCSGYEGYTLKKIYSYSSKGYLQTLLTRLFSGDSWADYDRSTFTYDRKGNVLSETAAFWDGTDWITYLTLEYTYNKAGWCTSLLYHDVFSDFTELVTMFYDHKGNRIKELGKYWNGTAYVNLEQWIYTYDKSGDKLRTLGQMWDGTAWADYKRETWTYLSRGKWLTDMVEYAETYGWLKYILYENAYNSEGYRESYTGSFWYEETGWNVEFGGHFTYDPHGNMVSNVQTYYAWWENPPYWFPSDSTATVFNYPAKTITATGYIHTGEEWIRGETGIYVPYNDHGTILVFADEYPSNLVKVFYSRTHPHHDADGDEEDLVAGAPSIPTENEFSLSVSPNPFSGEFTIRLTAPETGSFVITLYDGQGKAVREIFNGELGAGEHQIRVGALSGQPGGMMLLRAVSPDRSATVKLIRR